MEMNDDKHADRYVRITNRERFLIVRALSLLEHSCEMLGFEYDGLHITQELSELYRISEVFRDENWLVGRNILTDKVLSVRAIRSLLDSNDGVRQ